MSAYEQKVQPPDKRWQYVLFAAEPYETIAFKIPSREVDKSEDKFWTLWNKDTKQVSTLHRKTLVTLMDFDVPSKVSNSWRIFAAKSVFPVLYAIRIPYGSCPA